MLAIIATGALVYALAAAGAITSAFSFPQAMLFAALISSTDPVATLSILKRVKAQVGPSSHRNHNAITPQPDRDQIVMREIVTPQPPLILPTLLYNLILQPLLYDLIFGESALNDALSIAIFNVFRNQCAACRVETTPTYE